MGRSSNAKKERRAQRGRVVVATTKSRGGRPRIHVDNAARYRAYRLRKKEGLVTGAATEPLLAEFEEVFDLSWFDSPEYFDWLVNIERRLGADGLAEQLERDAEIIFAEREIS